MNNSLKSLLKALLVSVITMAVLLFIFAFVASKSEDSTKNLELYGRIIFFISAFSGCFYSARNAPKSPVVYSLIFGGIYILITFAFSLLFGGGALQKLWIPYLGVIAVSLLASVAGAKKKPKKPKRLKAFKKAKKA